MKLTSEPPTVLDIVVIACLGVGFLGYLIVKVW